MSRHQFKTDGVSDGREGRPTSSNRLKKDSVSVNKGEGRQRSQRNMCSGERKLDSFLSGGPGSTTQIPLDKIKRGIHSLCVKQDCREGMVLPKTFRSTSILFGEQKRTVQETSQVIIFRYCCRRTTNTRPGRCTHTPNWSTCPGVRILPGCDSNYKTIVTEF